MMHVILKCEQPLNLYLIVLSVVGYVCVAVWPAAGAAASRCAAPRAYLRPTHGNGRGAGQPACPRGRGAQMTFSLDSSVT